MRRSITGLARSLSTTTTIRGFSTKAEEKIVASVLFERLPVVLPQVDPLIYAFKEFSFRWRQQYRRKYPDEFLDRSTARGKGDYQIDYKQLHASLKLTKRTIERVNIFRIFNLYKCDIRVYFFRSLQRALDRRLYLLLYGNAYGTPSDKPVWHFPEKVYDAEETLRKCAESALTSVLGDLSHTYFVGNAPMGHIVMQPTDKASDAGFKRFFFKSQVNATNKFKIGKCEDFVWVTKDELLEYFPEQAEFFKKMIIS